MAKIRAQVPDVSKLLNMVWGKNNACIVIYLQHASMEQSLSKVYEWLKVYEVQNII